MKKIFVILSVFFLFSYIVSSKEEEYKDLGYNYYYVKKGLNANKASLWVTIILGTLALIGIL